jgi:hypothetical protein
MYIGKMEDAMTETLPLSTDVGAAIPLMANASEEDPLTDEGGRSLESLIGTALQLANGLHSAWSQATQNAKVWESGSYLRRIQAIDFLAAVVVDILTRTGQILSSTRQKHPDWAAPAGAADVEARLRTATELAAKVRETLSWMNRPRRPVSEEMLRRSEESLNRGEGEDVGEIIARLQSGGALVKE